MWKIDVLFISIYNYKYRYYNYRCYKLLYRLFIYNFKLYFWEISWWRVILGFLLGVFFGNGLFEGEWGRYIGIGRGIVIGIEVLF